MSTGGHPGNSTANGTTPSTYEPRGQHRAGRQRASAEDQSPTMREVPRVAIVAPSLEILGGQGVQARSLIRALAADGVTVSFIPVNPRFPSGLRWLRRVPVIRTLLNQCLYVASLVRLRNSDVVHVFSASYWSFLLAPVPAILAARLYSKRVILNYHSGEADDHLTRWGRHVHPWLRRVDEIVVPSMYLQTVFASHGYRASVIRNIIDPSAFRFRFRQPLRPRLLSNRNLERHYRIDVILKAFSILKAHRPDAHLTIAGYGSEQFRLQQLAVSEGVSGVDFLGRVEPAGMPALYEANDVFLNASVIDNQPVSILEAFASGLPVISTPTGDIAHMLDGARGTLVSTDDPVGLAAAIEHLLDAPLQALKMTLTARAEVEKYSWEGVGRQWIAAYCNSSTDKADGSNFLVRSRHESTASRSHEAG